MAAHSIEEVNPCAFATQTEEAATAATADPPPASSDDGNSSSSTALVLFSHANAFYNPFLLKRRQFRLAGRDIQIAQLTDSKDVGTGGGVWDASFVLSDYLDRTVGRKWEGRRVVDLGAGLGLLSITLASLGASVTATDGDEKVLPALRDNIQANLPDSKVDVRHYWWGSDLSAAGLAAPYDAIVASDVVYKREAFEPLIQALCDLSDSRTQIVIGYKLRYEWQKLFFVKVAKQFAVTAVERTEIHADFREYSGIDIAWLQRLT